MASKRLIDGFDYVLGCEVKRTRSDWIGLARPILSKGGRRRVENGETFIHSSVDGALLMEIYENIAVSMEDA